MSRILAIDYGTKRCGLAVTDSLRITTNPLDTIHPEKLIEFFETYFKENPEKWEEYHKISKENEESFPEEEIPRNKMIKYLEDLPGKKKKVVADLGCGFAEINQHFQDNSRFEFHNFDHVLIETMKN